MSEDIQAFLDSKKPEGEENDNPEEEIKSDTWKIVDLPEVQQVRDEDIAEIKFSARARLYRWNEE